MKIAFGLGSNVGDRLAHLHRAIEMLDRVGEAVAESSLYETAPVGPDQPRYLNLAVVVEWPGSVAEALAAAKRIEAELGRQPRGRWMPREIDVDVLLAGHGPHAGAGLRVPHPRLAERAFALVPLAEIAPRWMHPEAGRSVAELLAAASRTDGDVVPFASPFHPWHASPIDDVSLEFPSSDVDGLEAMDVADACRRFGGVLVRDVVDPGTAASFFNGLRVPFAWPSYAKARYQRGGALQGFGYTPPGVERVKGGDPDVARHFWDIGPDGAGAPDTVFHPGRELHARLEAIAAKAIRALDRSFGTDMAAGAIGGAHLIRATQYLNAAADGELLFPAHVDWGLATLFLGGSADGLEIRPPGQDWRSIRLPEGSALFAPGTLGKMYADGKISALCHRVRASSVGRISAAYFCEVRPDVRLPNGELASERWTRLMAKIRRPGEAA